MPGPGPGFILRGKFFPPHQITKSFEGKTVIVTGSNTGVGYATALKYVELGASIVILGVRSIEKGETAKAQIEKTTGRPGVVQVWQLDMANFQSLDAFAKRAETLKKLDVLVLNAGIMSRSFRLSETG
jgi:NAD(P)-dependent dehydrogenase (short-subunit alcohol dehydrogenase family)